MKILIFRWCIHSDGNAGNNSVYVEINWDRYALTMPIQDQFSMAVYIECILLAVALLSILFSE